MPVLTAEDLKEPVLEMLLGLLLGSQIVGDFCLLYCSVIVAGNMKFASSIFLKGIFSPVDRQTNWEGFIT